MNKKLMLLAAGAMATLAFTLLPAVASAGEFTGDCKSGATCSATVAGGAASLGNTAGETISCTSVSGSASLTSGTSTGLIFLTFHGCKETATFFKFSCNSPGQQSGTIATGGLVAHLVYLGLATKLPAGILITNVKATFSCAGFSNKTVTGNVIGEITNPNCGSSSTSHQVTFSSFIQHGNQQWVQVTHQGTVFDLISNNDAGGSYSTSSLVGGMNLTYQFSEAATLTC
jgi:hypothetical protein